MAFLFAIEISKIAIPIKEQGQKPQGGTEAAIKRPATKGFNNSDLNRNFLNLL